MHFESLANELFLELFEYLSIIDLFRIFYNLNFRFKKLLLIHYRNYHLDFRSLSKHDFDLICQQYIPLIINQITSINLSDAEKTPEQTDRFYSYKFSLNQFVNLRSISWYCLRSTDILIKLMVDYHHLLHLSHLTFIKCKFRKEDKDIISNILNHIWSFPKLLHCHLDIRFDGGRNSIIPSVISSSIQYLFIIPFHCELIDLARLFEYTPCLQQFHAFIESDVFDEPILSPVSSITVLNLQVFESTDLMIHLLQNTPNLCHLTIVMWEIIMNGRVLEKLITNHLVKLKIFRFEMNFDFPNDDNKEQKIDELLESFRTSFWIEERRSFVRCDWNRCLECDKRIHLYTLSYIDKLFFCHCQSGFRSKSTCPNNNDAWLFKQIQKFVYIQDPSDGLASPYLCFSNIRKLQIDVPLDDKFWSCFRSFDHLTSLLIECENDNDDSTKFDQVQLLLDRAPRLISLGFRLSAVTVMQLLPIKCVSESIRRLYLQETDHFFDDQQCTMLSQSSLGIQCEILSIRVKHRTNVIDLVNTMINLRVLNVLCEEDVPDNDNDQSSPLKDELIQWLQHHLSSTCNITRNKDETHVKDFITVKTILIWIR